MNKENLRLMVDLAAERGYQLWIEKFQEEPSDIGFHIIDGAIAFEDGEAVEPIKETTEDETPNTEKVGF